MPDDDTPTARRSEPVPTTPGVGLPLDDGLASAATALLAPVDDGLASAATALPAPLDDGFAFFRSVDPPRLDTTGRYLVVSSKAHETHVLDLTGGARWLVPWDDRVVSISPGGRSLLLLEKGNLARADLAVPESPAELKRWIANATNYTLDEAVEKD